MRYIRYAFLILVAVVLVTVALANRDLVTVQLLPAALTGLAGMDPGIQLPLFVVIFASIAVGLLIGFVWEWMREAKHRGEATRKSREARQLEREVSRLKDQKNEGKDEVLALLEDTETAR